MRRCPERRGNFRAHRRPPRKHNMPSGVDRTHANAPGGGRQGRASGQCGRGVLEYSRWAQGAGGRAAGGRGGAGLVAAPPRTRRSRPCACRAGTATARPIHRFAALERAATGPTAHCTGQRRANVQCAADDGWWARSAGEMERAKDDGQRETARRGSLRGRKCGASEDGTPCGIECATCNVLVSIAPGLVFRHLRVLTGMARD